MSPQAKKSKGKNHPTTAATPSDHVLLHPEDWPDPKDRRVIGEYHKGSQTVNGTEKVMGEIKQSQNTADPQANKSLVKKIIDVATIELMTYTISRGLFHKGVRVPLYIKGAVDMDIAVKDTEIILNTNDVAFKPPPLQIWHIIFSYKGKPVFEYGRGVKNTIKIHNGHALLFIMAMWIGGRKRRKAREKATLDACMDLAQNPPEKPKKNHERKASGDT